jgi:DNA relaxase NicK
MLDDLRDWKARKKYELEYYNKELNALLIKMGYLKAEINLTTRIIQMVEQDKITCIRRQLQSIAVEAS